MGSGAVLSPQKKNFTHAKLVQFEIRTSAREEHTGEHIESTDVPTALFLDMNIIFLLSHDNASVERLKADFPLVS